MRLGHEFKRTEYFCNWGEKTNRIKWNKQTLQAHPTILYWRIIHQLFSLCKNENRIKTLCPFTQRKNKMLIFILFFCRRSTVNRNTTYHASWFFHNTSARATDAFSSTLVRPAVHPKRLKTSSVVLQRIKLLSFLSRLPAVKTGRATRLPGKAPVGPGPAVLHGLLAQRGAGVPSRGPRPAAHHTAAQQEDGHLPAGHHHHPAQPQHAGAARRQVRSDGLKPRGFTRPERFRAPLRFPQVVAHRSEAQK